MLIGITHSAVIKDGYEEVEQDVRRVDDHDSHEHSASLLMRYLENKQDGEYKEIE